MKLEPRATAAGVRLIAHEVLGSTNTEALQLARHGERGPLWIAAQRQSAGRGRRGRAWISPPGNLYASLLLTGPAAAERWPQLSFVAALAIHDAVVEVAADLKPRLAIKWPNDLLLAGAKFAGILIEGEGDVNAVAVGAPVSPATLFSALSIKMLGRIAQWNGGEGFSTIRADWLARASGIGEGVHVRLAERELVGRFEALDEAGALVLRSADGNTTTITAGDVFTAEAFSPDKAS